MVHKRVVPHTVRDQQEDEERYIAQCKEYWNSWIRTYVSFNPLSIIEDLQEFHKKTSIVFHKNPECLSTRSEFHTKTRMFHMMSDVDVMCAEPVVIMKFELMPTRISEGVKYKKKRDDNNKWKHDDKNTEKHHDKIKGNEIRSSMIGESSDTITGSSNSTETSSWRSWQEHLHVVCDWVGKDYRDCVHDAEKSVKADVDKKLRRKQSMPECRDWWDNDNEKSMSSDDGERKFIWEQHDNALLWTDSRTGADRKYNDDDEGNHEVKDKRVSTTVQMEEWHRKTRQRLKNNMTMMDVNSCSEVHWHQWQHL